MCAEVAEGKRRSMASQRQQVSYLFGTDKASHLDPHHQLSGPDPNFLFKCVADLKHIQDADSGKN